MARYNPFRPNRPVSPSSFVGRLREVERIDAQLLQARAGNPGGFLVTGERGIGKTSLLLHARAAAEGRAVVPGERRPLSFLVVQTDVEPSTTQLGLARKIELGLRKALEANEQALSALRRTWEFLQRLQAAGIGLKPRDSSPALPDETLVEELAFSLAATANAVSSSRVASDWGLARQHDGVLLLIDEADSANAWLHLGSFVKLLSERVQRHGCDRLLIGLAGTPKVREVLERSHESSLRLFEELELEPLGRDDTLQVLELGLLEANHVNGRVTQLTPDGRDVLAHLAEGHPHFIQQFAHSAFERDDDWVIDVDDVVDGAIGPGGAIDLLGNRLYREIFYVRLQGESLRDVLRVLAARRGRPLTAAAIGDRMDLQRDALERALVALTALGVVVREEGDPDRFKLYNRGLGMWIRLFGKDPATVKAESLASITRDPHPPE